MVGHKVLPKDALHLLTNALGATGDTEVAVVLKRVAGDIARNLPLRRHEIPMHHNSAKLGRPVYHPTLEPK